MLCLARSRKYGGVCIAGLRTDEPGRWLRPVGLGDGTLLAEQYMTDNGDFAGVLDVLRVPVQRDESAPHAYQTENRFVRHNVRWSLAARPAAKEIAVPLLRAAICRPSHLFGCANGTVTLDDLVARGARESLTLVYPKKLRWRIARARATGNRKTCAIFTLGGVEYDLPITCPDWEKRLLSLPEGEHPREAADIDASERLLFTISLGEPFGPLRACYKLVAGVLLVPRDWIGTGDR